MTIDEALAKLEHAKQIAGHYTPDAIYDLVEVVRELVLVNVPPAPTQPSAPREPVCGKCKDKGVVADVTLDPAKFPDHIGPCPSCSPQEEPGRGEPGA